MDATASGTWSLSYQPGMKAVAQMVVPNQVMVI